ncbi:MAG: O-antigen ligase family protein [Pseudomonadota bacterium]
MPPSFASKAAHSGQASHVDPKMRWLVLGAFALLLAFTGGTSITTQVHHALLRPIAGLLLAAALYWWRAREAYDGRALLIFLGGWMLWTFLQLVPLPGWMWQNLPDRNLIAELGGLLGLQDQWRPISLVPTRGWNALAGLVVPLAALLLAITLRARAIVLLNLIVGIALIDATFNMLQLLSGGQDTFYLYRPHPGQTDGAFSNENHSGVFSALSLLVATRLLLSPKPPQQKWFNIGYGAAYLFLLLAILTGGSRAGIVAGLGAVLSSGAMFALVLRPEKGPAKAPASAPVAARGAIATRLAALGRWPFLLGAALAFTALVSLFFWLGRSPSVDGVLTRNAFEDLRWDLAPVLWEMVQANWLFGIGFGSFEEYYHLYEPTELLLPEYINQAHNDWAQLVLEGGIVAVALLVGLGVWATGKIRGMLAKGESAWPGVIFWLSLAVLIAAASLVDYPLRTAIFQVAIVWLLFVLDGDDGAWHALDLGRARQVRSNNRRGKKRTGSARR